MFYGFLVFLCLPWILIAFNGKIGQKIINYPFKEAFSQPLYDAFCSCDSAEKNEEEKKKFNPQPQKIKEKSKNPEIKEENADDF